MENPKLSFASPYSYSLFQGGSPTQLQESVLPTGTDNWSTWKQAPDSLAQLCFFLPAADPKVTLGDESTQNPTTQVVFMQGKGLQHLEPDSEQ